MMTPTPPRCGGGCWPPTPPSYNAVDRDGHGVCENDPRSRSAPRRRTGCVGGRLPAPGVCVWIPGLPGRRAATQVPCRHPGDRRASRRRRRPTKKSAEITTNPTARPAGAAAGPRCAAHPLLAEAIRTGATVKPIRMPPGEPEPAYRPSTELAGSSGCAICSVASPAATCPPNCVTSTTPGPSRWAPPTPRTSNAVPTHHLMKTFCRHRRLDRCSTARRHPDLDLPHRHELHDQARQPAVLPRLEHPTAPLDPPATAHRSAPTAGVAD